MHKYVNIHDFIYLIEKYKPRYINNIIDETSGKKLLFSIKLYKKTINKKTIFNNTIIYVYKHNYDILHSDIYYKEEFLIIINPLLRKEKILKLKSKWTKKN